MSVGTEIRPGVGRSRGKHRSVMAALITRLVREWWKTGSVMGKVNGRGYSKIPREVDAGFTT